MTETSVSLALVAIVGTVITALFKLLNDNTKALNKIVDASNRVGEATEKAADEAKERNGHLGEQSLKIAKLVTQGNHLTKEGVSVSKEIVKELKDAGVKVEAVKVALETSTTDQHIEHQVVDKQVVKNKE